jgi:Xaa-Pro aminopeptidase
VLVASSSSRAITAAIPVSKLYQTYNIISNIKCIKNDVEAEGMRLSHIRDGVAVVRYLHWLENHVDTEVVTELSGAAVLGGFRRYDTLQIKLLFSIHHILSFAFQ